MFSFFLSLRSKVLDLPRLLRQGLQHGSEGLRHVQEGEELRHASIQKPSGASAVSGVEWSGGEWSGVEWIFCCFCSHVCFHQVAHSRFWSTASWMVFTVFCWRLFRLLGGGTCKSDSLALETILPERGQVQPRKKRDSGTLFVSL